MAILNLLKRITGLSTPIFGISWAFSTTPAIEKFTQPVYLTGYGNEDFIEFLNRNDKNVIALDLTMDASISIEMRYKDRGIFKKIRSGQLNGLTVPLYSRSGDINCLEFHFCSQHPQISSNEETGVFEIPIRSLFDVVRTIHSGPSRIFYLKEVTVPVHGREWALV
jgi:hypothetical protein